jgi:hypothetical protein
MTGIGLIATVPWVVFGLSFGAVCLRLRSSRRRRVRSRRPAATKRGFDPDGDQTAGERAGELSGADQQESEPS